MRPLEGVRGLGASCAKEAMKASPTRLSSREPACRPTAAREGERDKRALFLRVFRNLKERLEEDGPTMIGNCFQSSQLLRWKERLAEQALVFLLSERYPSCGIIFWMLLPKRCVRQPFGPLLRKIKNWRGSQLYPLRLPFRPAQKFV